MATTPNSGMSQEDINSYLELAQAMGVAAKSGAQMAADFERLKERAREANNVLDGTESKLGKLSKQLGMTGAVVNKLAGGIKSQFSKMGADISLDMRKVNAEMAKGLEGTAGRFNRAWSSAKIGAKEVGKQLASSLEDPKNQLGMLEKSVEFLHGRFKIIDNDAKDLAKSLNLTFVQAQGVRDNFNQIALASGDMSVTGQSLTKSMVEMNAALGTSARFDSDRLKTYTRLRDIAKVDKDVLEDTNKMSFVANQSQMEVFGNRIKSIAVAKVQNRLALDESKIMKDMVKASAAIKLNYAGRDKEFARATVQAAKLGLELSDMETIQRSLLNFESSIENQMTAELLTGRTFNMEQARLFALKKDMVGLGSELQKQNLSFEQFNSLNYIQQQGVADMLGMSVEQMSKMYIESEALSRVSAANVSEAQKQYDAAVKNGTQQQFLAKLGDDSLARQFQQQSLQDRMNMALEKMLSIFDKLAVAFRPVYKVATAILDVITWIEEKVGAITRGLATVMGNQAVQKVANLGGKLSEASVQTGTGLTAKALESAGLTSVTKGATGAAAASILKKAGGSALEGATEGGMVNFAKLLPNLGKTTFGRILRSGIVAPLVETWLANSDINGLVANPDISDSDLPQKVGERAVGGIGAIIGGITGAGLANLLTVTGIPGFLATTVASTLGATGGQWLFSKAAELFGARGMGESVLGAFFDDEMKAAGRPELKTGGEVLSTGFAKVDSGEFYAGMNSSDTVKAIYDFSRAAAQSNTGGVSSQDIKDLIAETRKQNEYLQQIARKDTSLVVDGSKLAGVVANNVATSYGNLLNPSSRTFA